MNRIKELPSMTDIFPPSIQGVSGSRDETMDMRMKCEVLTPCVKHGYCSGPDTIVRVSRAVQGVPYGRK
jgi:hypothetical protein